MKNLLCLAGVLLFTLTTTYAQDCKNEEAQSHLAKADLAMEKAKNATDYLYAIDELKKALQYAPDCSDIYLNIGFLYDQAANTGLIEDIGYCNQAIENFKKYLKIKPDSPKKQEVQDKIYEVEYKRDQLIKKYRKRPVSFGFFGGYNASNLSFTGNEQANNFNSKTGPGVQAGIFLEFRLSNNVSFQPGINFAQYISGIDNDFELTYLEFPINILLKYKIYKSTWYVGLGPIINYNLNNTIYGYYTDVESQPLIKKTDVSFNFKLGYSIHAFFMEFGYKAGMTNLSLDNNVSIKRNSYYGSLGLKF